MSTGRHRQKRRDTSIFEQVFELLADQRYGRCDDQDSAAAQAAGEEET
jgi:hypothetical protein